MTNQHNPSPEDMMLYGHKTHFSPRFKRSQQWVEFPIFVHEVENPRFGCKLPTCCCIRGPIEKWHLKPGMKKLILWVPTELIWRAYLVGGILSKILGFCRVLGLTARSIDECVPGQAGLAEYRNPKNWYVACTPRSQNRNCKG
jgi:hypothetical protein